MSLSSEQFNKDAAAFLVKHAVQKHALDSCLAALSPEQVKLCRKDPSICQSERQEYYDALSDWFCAVSMQNLAKCKAEDASPRGSCTIFEKALRRCSDFAVERLFRYELEQRLLREGK